MARNRRTRIANITPDQAKGVLEALVVYLEALEDLLQKSTTLPESTKVTASTTLAEIDYLVGVYSENTFHFPHKN